MPSRTRRRTRCPTTYPPVAYYAFWYVAALCEKGERARLPADEVHDVIWDGLDALFRELDATLTRLADAQRPRLRLVVRQR